MYNPKGTKSCCQYLFLVCLLFAVMAEPQQLAPTAVWFTSIAYGTEKMTREKQDRGQTVVGMWNVRDCARPSRRYSLHPHTTANIRQRDDTQPVDTLRRHHINGIASPSNALGIRSVSPKHSLNKQQPCQQNFSSIRSVSRQMRRKQHARLRVVLTKCHSCSSLSLSILLTLTHASCFCI